MGSEMLLGLLLSAFVSVVTPSQLIPGDLQQLHRRVLSVEQRTEKCEHENAELREKIGYLKKLEKCMEENSELKGSSTGGVGSTYVRWGRSECAGNGTEVVYDGYVGGTQYDEGNAANYLCLPKNPQWKLFDEKVESGGKIYGSELQTSDLANFPKLKALHNNDPVCAVCMSKRSRVLMLPAKTTCPDGWTEEYEGYLVSDSKGHKSSEFICLDMEPEVRHGSNANNNGHLMYLVDSICGSLPCPPYVQGRELTCVVCTK